MMGTKMDKVLGIIDVDLDGRFSAVRTQETNLGVAGKWWINWITLS